MDMVYLTIICLPPFVARIYYLLEGHMVQMAQSDPLISSNI